MKQRLEQKEAADAAARQAKVERLLAENSEREERKQRLEATRLLYTATRYALPGPVLAAQPNQPYPVSRGQDGGGRDPKWQQERTPSGDGVHQARGCAAAAAPACAASPSPWAAGFGGRQL